MSKDAAYFRNIIWNGRRPMTQQRHVARAALWLLIPTLALLGCLSLGGCPFIPGVGNGNANENANSNANSNSNTNANTNDNGKVGNSGLSGKFVGSQRCSECHRNTHTEWSGTDRKSVV